MDSSFYKVTDKAIATLNKRAVKRFNETTKHLNLLGFDELSVIQQVKTLYERLDADNKEVFLELANTVYSNAYKLAVLRRNAAKAKREAEEQEEVEEITEFWLLDFLDSYNKTVHVIYSNEVFRKRDYAIEYINSSVDKNTELKKALVKWSRFTGWFADEVTDEATLKAYRDAGIKKVIWHTNLDGKECKICKGRDGEEYPINDIPTKPHPGCRCWYTPA